MSEQMMDIWDNVPLLYAVRDLCPRKRSGMSEIIIESRGQSVTLTYETRRKIDARLKQLAAVRAQKGRS